MLMSYVAMNSMSNAEDPVLHFFLIFVHLLAKSTI